MKHIVILDDSSKQNKAFLALAKALNKVKILTPKQWDAIEDEWMATEIAKGLKTPVVTELEVKKTLKKMRGK